MVARHAAAERGCRLPGRARLFLVAGHCLPIPMAYLYPYEKVTTVTTILGRRREKCIWPTKMAMYMVITAAKKADAPGYVVLVPARAGKRDGCIWHWQGNGKFILVRISTVKFCHLRFQRVPRDEANLFSSRLACGAVDVSG